MKKKINADNPLIFTAKSPEQAKWARAMLAMHEMFDVELPPIRRKRADNVTTVPQARQQTKFGYAATLASKFNHAAKIGYDLATRRKVNTPMNCVTVSIMKATVVDDKNGMLTDYSKIKISEGGRCPLCKPVLLISTSGEVSINWLTSKFYFDIDADNDHVYLLIYSETQDKVLYSDFIGQQKDGAATLQIDPIGTHEQLHCYNFLQVDKGFEVSVSDYIKNVTVYAAADS